MGYKGPRRTLGEQFSEMRRLHPEFECSLRRNVLLCHGTIHPTPLSDEFTVQIRYDLNKRATVTVLQPALLPLPSKKIPHRFPDGSLCLHMPGEWDPWMAIAETIVPWTALWLYYYEIWRITGQWLGGGHEPTRRRR